MDGGTFIGSRSSLLVLLSRFTHSGPSFGLHIIILSKCELYWPSGDCSFSEFPHAIEQVNLDSSGLELLGAPLWGPPTFLNPFAELGDPHVELHLLKSCLDVCEITHILHCVPSSLLICI